MQWIWGFLALILFVLSQDAVSDVIALKGVVDDKSKELLFGYRGSNLES